MHIDQSQYYKVKNILHTFVLLVSMLLLLALIGWLIAGLAGLIWTFFSGLLLLLIIPAFASRLTLYLYHARMMPLSEVHEIIHAMARRCQLPRVPAVYYLPSPAMLAFSTGFYPDQSIAVSDGMLRYLNHRELTAVLAHEMSHLKNRDLWVMVIADVISRLTAIMALFGYLMLVIYLPSFIIAGEAVPWLLILTLILAPNASALLQLALSRTREFTADAMAIKLTGDPLGLISALNKLNKFEQHWLKQMLLPGYRHPQPSLLRSHPLTEERIKRLLKMAQSNKPLDEEGGFISFKANQPRSKPRHRFTGIWH